MAYLKDKRLFAPISSDMHPLVRSCAKRIAGDLTQVLADYLSAAAFAWLSQNRPDVSRYLEEALTCMRVASLNSDRKEFIEAVVSCASMFDRAIKVYEKDMIRASRIKIRSTMNICADQSNLSSTK